MQEKKELRKGFTTGSSATAAAKAALLAIMNQSKVRNVEINLPKERKLEIAVSKCTFSKDSARCSVIKDGGDDPDVTHGAEIIVDMQLTAKKGEIEIAGGEGVGTVTKEGLGLQLNGPAINPVPRKMITENLKSAAGDILRQYGIKVTISVPKGRELAQKTDNPRLGIIGGISILGTTGIVIPFSTASFAASIRQNIDVALASGDSSVVLTTGGRSEEFAKKIIKLPYHCFVQMGDFSGYAIQQCSKKGIKEAHVVGFIGKLAKMAKGIKQTHVKGSKVDMNFLASLAKDCNASKDTIDKIRNANTARHVSEIILESSEDGSCFFENICKNVYRHMREYSEGNVSIIVMLFNFDGDVLARYPAR